MNFPPLCKVVAIAAPVLALALASAGAQASGLSFASTSDAASWQVATQVGGLDGALSSFPTTGFTAAVSVTGRTTDGTGWIANNDTGTNGCCVGNWTFFVFRQTVDLTGYNPATADLQFQWAADDSGQGYASRGTWTPKYSVNGGSLVDGVWADGYTYSFGPTAEVSSGFVNGLNTIDFYVEGNGVTDGFALKTIGFTATAVPEPESVVLMLMGLGALAGVGRRRA